MQGIKLSIVVATIFAIGACSTLEPKLSSSSKVLESRQVTVKTPPQTINTFLSNDIKSSRNALGVIDFRREVDGSGKAIIALPYRDVAVSVFKNANKITLKLSDISVGQPISRLDVADFATPVSSIYISRHGKNAHIELISNSSFEYETSREASNYIVKIKTIKQVKKGIKVHDLPVQKGKKYTGEKLTLNFQDIEIRSVLQLLADFTDINIVVSDTVKGSVTLRLKDIPWDQALDIVLESKALGMRKNGNVIWVTLAKELEAKKKREFKALQRLKELEPLVTEYISVNFAKAEDLLKIVKSSSRSKDSSLLSKRGSITVDSRTNKILVQDMAFRVEKIKDMVKRLDVAIKQVSIEARIVIANDEFGKSLGTRFGVTNLATLGSRSLVTSSGGVSATNAMVNDAASSSVSGNLSPVNLPSLDDRLNVNMPIAGAAGKFAFSILSKSFLLDLELSALQAENKGEVISTPRIVTANKKMARIEQGVEVPYLEASSSGATSVSFKKAVLSLEVTPQITSDNHVIMDLKINQDTVGAIFSGVPSINTREINTQVLVESGQTVVLGGVHEEQHKNDVEKVPVLGDLPIVGSLFSRKYKTDTKRELLVFITPRVL